MSARRRLAAIVFTDIVGYTAAMNEDEDRAFELLRRNRELHRSCIEQHGGAWVKEMGDGVMSWFETATAAVLCALSIQRDSEQIPGLRLRIGVHLGDVVFDDGDVFGDGVNVASHLQALAPIGGIWVSDAVYRNISNKKEIETRPVRSEKLKNVPDPLPVYEIVTPGSSGRPAGREVEPRRSGSEMSIAVLPFANMSNDPEQDYFSYGIAEEILNSLAHARDLKVAARASAFQFHGKHVDLREVGRQLNVKTILDGSVRKQGNRLRITAQLVSVEDGYHLWSERYDRDLDDVFAIQDEIALAITEKLKGTLLQHEKDALTTATTENTEAYELYLKGRFYLARRGRYIVSAYECLQRSIELDSRYAPSHAAFADACLLLAYYAFYPAGEVMPKAKAAADAALELDPALCEPYTSLGFYYGYYERDFAKSRKNFLRAIELNPRYVHGLIWYAMLYLGWIAADFEEAIQVGSTAIHLDPLSSIAHALQSVNYYVAHDYAEAERIGKIAIDLDASSYVAHQMTGLAMVGSEKFAEAIEILRHAMEMSRGYHWAVFNLAWAYRQAGDHEVMAKLVRELEARAATEYIPPFHRGLAAAWGGDLDTAISHLERAYDERDPTLLSIRTWPYVPEALKADPRCRSIIERIGYP